MSGGLTLAQVRELLAAPDLLAAARPYDLAASARLRSAWPPDLVAAATAQAALRTTAAAKFDRAPRMLFTRPGLEQATALPIARLAADRLIAGVGPGEAIVDLCCGIGGDAIALAGAAAARAPAVGPVIAVDRDPVQALLCRHNVSTYDEPVHAAVGDVTRSVRVGRGDAVHVDPARRDPAGPGVGGRRGGYRPDLAWCTTLAAERICVKVAPGITVPERPAGWETEWVSVHRHLKVALLWAPALAGGARRATVIGDDGAVRTRITGEATAPPPVGPPGEWVIDPDPALTRAGAVGDLAAEVGGRLIDPRIAFVCTDDRPVTSWGRVLRVAASLPFTEREVAAELRRLNPTDLQIRRRGLAGDVDALRHRLRRATKGPAGEPRRCVVLLTRHQERPWALLCTEPHGEPGRPAAT